VQPTIAVLIPCFNESVTIEKVVGDFRAALPQCTVFVYDNNSTDDTAELARKSGAVVRHEPQQGKGNVVRRMFADIEADIFVLVDGDDTYDASAAPGLIDKLIRESLDMVSATRFETSADAYRSGHRLGNRVLTGFVAMLFGNRSSDMLSGYRVFSRRFVKSFPALTTGFEIETELTVHALELRLPIAETTSRYRERPAGSVSKLHTYSDGMRILRTIVILVKEEKPLLFFGALAIALALTSVILGAPIVDQYRATGLVPRLPTAVLATGFMLLAALSLICGLILDSVSRGRKEQKRLRYLGIPIRYTTSLPAPPGVDSPKKS
jgi:glycosyltransferase involved in cell wall biosynthesis